MAGRNIIPNPHKSAHRAGVSYTAINNAYFIIMLKIKVLLKYNIYTYTPIDIIINNNMPSCIILCTYVCTVHLLFI